MKRKFLNYEHNKNIIDTKFKYQEIKTEEFNGNIGYLKINKVKNKINVKTKDYKEYCICDSGYTFISICEYNKKYLITAMYDEKEKLIQLYIDIIKEAGICKGVPYIDDMYLDIVVRNDNSVEVLDEEELKEALEEKLISKEEFDLANKTKEELVVKLSDNAVIENLRNKAKIYLGKFKLNV